MNYINTTTNDYSITEQQIRGMFPNVSFPTLFEPPNEFKPVFPTPVPLCDSDTQCVRETAPTLTSKGWYEQTWEVIDLDPEIAEANQRATYERSIPKSVSRRQFKRALLQLELLGLVEGAIASSVDKALQIDYAEATEFDRSNLLVRQMGLLLGKDEAEIDNLFKLAGTL